jgi:hypothetical protein
MSYTTPSTAVTGGTLTTNIWNTEVRDNLNYLRNYGTALAGTAGTAWSVTTLAGTAGTAVNLTATQGSVNAINASLGSVSGTVSNITNQPIGTAIGTAAAAGSVYTLVTSDSGKLLMCAGTASGTVQIPVNSSQAFFLGQKVDIAQLGTGTVTIVGTAGVTLRSTPSAILRTQYSAASVVKIGTDEWLLMGDLL